jgi:mRNA interferase MazF
LTVPPNNTPQRGDVWWVDLDPARSGENRKTRPAVIVSADGLNRARRTVVIVPLSTGPEPYLPLVVSTPSFDRAFVAVCDQVRSVDKTRLTRLAGTLSTADLRAIESGLRAILRL